MKTIIRKILAVCMVAILMLSTTSFSVYKHFCGNDLVEISNYKTIDDCCDVVVKSSKSDNLSFSAEDCCKNESAQKDLLHFDSNEVVKIKKSQAVVITSFYLAFIKQFEEQNGFNNFNTNFSPPDYEIDRQILFQNFLI